MSSTSVKTSTIIYASLGTLTTLTLGYFIYFDYRRRHDAEFRRALKRESKRQSKIAKTEAEGAKKQERAEIRELVDEANEEGFPTDADEKEAFFMQEVGQGEVLCQQSKYLLFERGGWRKRGVCEECVLTLMCEQVEWEGRLRCASSRR